MQYITNNAISSDMTSVTKTMMAMLCEGRVGGDCEFDKDSLSSRASKSLLYLRKPSMMVERSAQSQSAFKRRYWKFEVTG